MRKGDRVIRLSFRSHAGMSWSARFTTLRGAQKKAQKHLGPHPEVGWGYAVAGDGCYVTVTGATLEELFPENEEA